MRLWAFIVLIFGAVSMPAAAGDLDAKFLIKRAGKVIGYHIVGVTETADGYIVDAETRMRVKLGPIPLFKYDHESREVWKNGELVSLDSRTNHDGDRYFVEAERIDGVLMIDGSGYHGAAPAGAVPSSYWDKSFMETDAVIDTQTGEIIDVSVTRLGETRAPAGLLAEQFLITGTLAVNVWYDGEICVGSHFTVDGEELVYVPAPADKDRQYAVLTAGHGARGGR